MKKFLCMTILLILSAVWSHAQYIIRANFFGSGNANMYAASGIRYLDVSTRNLYKQITIPQGNSWVLESQNVLVDFSYLQGVVPITKGGTGQTTATAALNALLPTQTGNNTKFLQTDGTNATWQSAGGGTGTVTSISQGSGITLTPNPITTNGTVRADTSLLATQYYVTSRGYGIGTVTSVATGVWLSGGTITGAGTIIADSATMAAYFLRRSDSTSVYATQFDITGFGTGSVTSVAVSGANGIGVSGSPITTSGTIALSLGAITPTSVNGITFSGSGSITNSGTTSLTGFTGSGTSSGTNTGDQTIAGLSPLTTKGDLFTYSSVNTRLAVGATDGMILGVSSAAATGLLWSTPAYPMARGSLGTIIRSDGTNNVYTTATYPATTTANRIVYSSATNTIGEITSANSSVLVTDGSGVPSLSTTIPNGVVATTQTAADNSTKIATTAYADASKRKYVLCGASLFTSGASNPADATTYYIGQRAILITSITTGAINRVYIPYTGTITYAQITFYQTAGSSQTSTVSVRLNNTTNTTLSSSVTNDAATTTFNNTALSISVTQNDYIELEWGCPTWTPTNPTTVSAVWSVGITAN